MQTYYVETTTPKRNLELHATDLQDLAARLEKHGIKHITNITAKTK